MPRKITVTLVDEFTHWGHLYRRYQRADNGRCTDVKVQHRNGTVIYMPAQAKDEATRRLRGRWLHPHLVK